MMPRSFAHLDRHDDLDLQGAAERPCARLVATDGRELPLRHTALAAQTAGGLARVVLRQTFANHHREPLAVRYELPLPADGAVSAFAFTVGERRITGEIERRSRARERYEQALVAGHGAALLEQSRTSLFAQEIGNIPPGASVTAEIAIDQPLVWLAEGAWEWRFPTVVAPRYGSTAESALEVSATPMASRLSLELVIDDIGEARPTSTSHALSVSRRKTAAVVELAPQGGLDRDGGLDRQGGVRLDRDIVVSWPASGDAIEAAVAVARPRAEHAEAARAFGLVTLVPPKTPSDRVMRDLVLLIDASGSMHGEPLAQARRLALALVDSLDEGDSIEMIAFAMAPSRFSPSPLAATVETKAAARAWLEALEAGGGTEMRAAILAALAPLRGFAQRQVVLMSDGLIGFEEEIVTTILDRLPEGSRVHTVGVGSAVNRTLTAGAARAGRGVEVVLGIGDDVERALGRIVHHTAAPAVVELTLAGSALLEQAPARLPDLYAAAPARISLALRPEGGDLTIRGRTARGAFAHNLRVPPCAPGEGDMAIARRFALERVEDLETERCRGRNVDEEVERLGLAFAIATRLTSFIAVSSEPSVDPTAPSRVETMPHELPHGMSASGLGLRAPMAPPSPGMMRTAAFAMTPAPQAPACYAPPVRGARPRRAPGRAAHEPALTGRLRHLGNGRFAVEVILSRVLRWDPSAVEVVLADGSRLAVTLEPAQTTRPGDYGPATVLRVVFSVAAPMSAPPISLEIENDGQPCVVTLS